MEKHIVPLLDLYREVQAIQAVKENSIEVSSHIRPSTTDGDIML